MIYDLETIRTRKTKVKKSENLVENKAERPGNRYLYGCVDLIDDSVHVFVKFGYFVADGDFGLVQLAKAALN